MEEEWRAGVQRRARESRPRGPRRLASPRLARLFRQPVFEGLLRVCRAFILGAEDTCRSR